MDPITQSALGAALPQSLARPEGLRRAGLVGALGGFLPDADVLIRSPSDPLLFLDYHRQFTHSFAFIPLGGAITAALCVLLLRGRARFRELWLPATLGWATHGLLDACTSYGTYLYWPFDLERVAWHVISIVDPLFTLGLLAGVVLATRMRSRWPARFSLLFVCCYLAFCSLQVTRAQRVQDRLLTERGHQALRGEVKPAIGNNIVFRSIYESGGRYYSDAIRVSWFGATRVYPGDSQPIFSVQDFNSKHRLSALHRNDIERFRYFSADFVIEDPRYEGVLSDFRYAALPNAVAPLWGIDVLGTPAHQHLTFRHFRDIKPTDRKQFAAMLKGQPLP